jgi:hypothetical protein
MGLTMIEAIKRHAGPFQFFLGLLLRELYCRKAIDDAGLIIAVFVYWFLYGYIKRIANKQTKESEKQ